MAGKYVKYRLKLSPEVLLLRKNGNSFYSIAKIMKIDKGTVRRIVLESKGLWTKHDKRFDRKGKTSIELYGVEGASKRRQRASESMKGKLSGSKNPRWIGGVTPEKKLLRNSVDYREWRNKVLERDDYTCQKCGIRNHKGLGRSVKFHAHHIIPFAICLINNIKEKITDIDNGLTLCMECHYGKI